MTELKIGIHEFKSFEVCPKSNNTGVIKNFIKKYCNIPKSNSFKIIPFHLKTLMHLPFPRFKTFLEGIFWDLFELRCRSHFDGIDVRKMGSLQNRFDLKEEKKVAQGQIGGIWGCSKVAMFLSARN